jgi:hypothetical protein
MGRILPFSRHHAGYLHFSEIIYRIMNQLFFYLCPDKSGTLFSDQNGKVFNDYIQSEKSQK